MDSLPSKGRRWLTVLAVAAVVLAVSAVLEGCGARSDQAGKAATGEPPSAASAASDAFARIPQVVQRVQPAIVTIFALGDASASGVGSGVIYRSDGIILTNHHVVADASRLEVGFADGSRVPGRVVATDRDTDIAVVRVGREGLPAGRFQSALPRVGSLAVVLGSPLGFEKTVSVSYLRDGEPRTARVQIADRPA